MDKREIKINATIKVPEIPNYLMIKDGNSFKTISISSFTDDQLKIVGDAWTKCLIEKAKIKK